MRDTSYKFNPLGIAYIASYLQRQGIEIEIYDSYVENKTMDEIKEKIKNSDAAIIGITSVTTTIRESITIAEVSKTYGKTTVIGGCHISGDPIKTMESYPCFDYAVIGEGEITFFELIRNLRNKDKGYIKGLIWRKENKIIINEPRGLIKNISELPHPARNLLKNELYWTSDRGVFKKKKLFFNIITSRGCPHNCNFCASSVIWKKNLRLRTTEDVCRELDELNELGMEQLEIADDTFTINVDRVRTITEKIKTLGIEWGCQSRVDCIDEETMKLLKESNCKFIDFGIESGNQNILNIMKKGITLEQARAAIKLTKKYKIKSTCYFMIGNIGETEETIKDTIRFARELNPTMALFYMMTPYPGTELYEHFKREGYIKKDFVDYINPKYSEPVIEFPNLDAKKIRYYLKKAYRTFYFNPQFILKTTLKSIVSFSEFRANLKLFKNYLKVCK